MKDEEILMRKSKFSEAQIINTNNTITLNSVSKTSLVADDFAFV
jgi:hypothetical protein